MSQSTGAQLSRSSTSPRTVSPAGASRAERFYRPELDVLRFFAFFSVFTFHTAITVDPLPGKKYWGPIGCYGMPLFFFLSSYLITELLLREQEITRTVHIRSFYVRRILRIWPLYLFFVAAMVVWGHFFPEDHFSRGALLSLLLLTGNWYMAAYGPMPGPIGPLWSISLEEQFYLIWPTLAKKFRERGLLWLSIVLIPAAWLAMYVCGPLPLRQDAFSGVAASYERFWCNSFVQFQFFAMGALTSIFTRRRKPGQPNPLARSLLCVSGVAVWIYAGHFIRSVHEGDIPLDTFILWYLCMGIGCLLFFFSVSGIPQKWIPKQLLYLGKISYGLYVFHEVGLYISDAVRVYFGPHLWRWLALRYVGSFAVALLLAVISYKYFESPFLRLKERFAFIRSRPT